MQVTVLKQERAIVTRKRLTDAARQVFARCGFENARIEDIAGAAGKTRGAFYANFRDKEDVFYAIFEEDLARDREQVALHLSEASTSEQRIQALAQLLSEVIKDSARMLLVLEFKQYAIRHPKKKKRLADLHSAMCARCVQTDIGKLLGDLAATTVEEKRAQSAQIGALLEGIALNRMFDEASLPDQQVRRLLEAGLRVALAVK